MDITVLTAGVTAVIVGDRYHAGCGMLTGGLLTETPLTVNYGQLVHYIWT